MEKALKGKGGIKEKAKELARALFEEDTAPCDDVQYVCAPKLLATLLCGGEVWLEKLFGKEAYAALEESKISLGYDDEKLAGILQSLDEEDGELICRAKQIYDWSVLVDVLDGKPSISAAKVAVYEQHRQDLGELKYFIRRYLPERYAEVFRSKEIKANYVAYVGENRTSCRKGAPEKRTSREELCKYLRTLLSKAQVEESDKERFDALLARIEQHTLLPKQVDSDNRVIPYQLYYYEMKKILENAAGYLPFLREADESGRSVLEKLLSVFEFRIPYFVGPLKEASKKEPNHWMVRRSGAPGGSIYPWNFEEQVDLRASEEAFIRRMTNSCTYLPGESVLPKCSLVYSAFEVLNEINNIQINGQAIPVEVKQGIYNDVFMEHTRVTPKRISDYLISNGWMQKGDVMTGLDTSVKSSLRPHQSFRRLLEHGDLTHRDAERIIERITYSEDRARAAAWIRETYTGLSAEDVRYLSSLPFRDFGRLSRKLLCGIEDVDHETGECMTILHAMWETNCNFMQLMSDRFGFKQQVEAAAQAYYDASEDRSLSARLDGMRVSNAVKRPLIRTLDILRDIVKARRQPPARIFIEMARGGSEAQKGKRTSTRRQQLEALYQSVTEDVQELRAELGSFGEQVDNSLQRDALFLYFIQLGRCLYTGKRIELKSILAGDGTYNIEHIYPQSVVKDDSILNNMILVDSKENGNKKDQYPVSGEIRERMRGDWKRLQDYGLLTDEKFRRLTRATPFSEEERFEFINRQLVETRQSTKAVATLLRELYPETEIVYVRAGLVSELRQEFGILKSREVNDLHHAKDAYLNIVAGNVWHSKYSRQFWRPDETHNAKVGVVFGHPVDCSGKTVWRGEQDRERVVRIAQKNAVHMTVYPFCRQSGQNGGFFDQNPKKAEKGLVPLKKGRPTERYGGYQKPTATFFVLVRYLVGNKRGASIMPVDLLHAERFLADDAFAVEYARETLSGILGKTVDGVEFPLGKRVLKINTVLSLNGLRVCITGKSGGGKQLIVSCLTPFKTSPENEQYLKKLASFSAKAKKNVGIRVSEEHDGISGEKNREIYDTFVEKLQAPPYKYRPANPSDTLEKGRASFCSLTLEKQVEVLLAILGLFGRARYADLRAIGGKEKVGAMLIAASLSALKKTYTDVRVIDQSASGLFERSSGINLLDLL